MNDMNGGGGNNITNNNPGQNSNNMQNNHPQNNNLQNIPQNNIIQNQIKLENLGAPQMTHDANLMMHQNLQQNPNLQNPNLQNQNLQQNLPQNLQQSQLQNQQLQNIPQHGIKNQLGMPQNPLNIVQNPNQPLPSLPPNMPSTVNLSLGTGLTAQQAAAAANSAQHMDLDESPTGANGENADDDDDAEGVWSPDIEQCFQEALQMYPPCGRRKIILSEEGKMYGRNELIARYIKMRTGKTRTRKQVSSHIQVLARRKMREIQVGVKAGPLDAIRKDSILSSLANMSSAQIVSAAAGAKQLSQGLYNGSAFWNAQMDTMNAKQDAYQAARLVSPNGVTRITQFETVVEPKHSDSQITSEGQTIPGQPLHRFIKSNQKDQHVILQVNPLANPVPVDQPLEAIDIRQISDKFPNKNFEDMYDKSINKDCFYLVKFWADISYEMDANEMEAFYSTTQWFESVENVTIQVSTQVVSFAKKTVEKIETEVSKMDANTGRYICKFDKSPVCEYMVNFIHKLKHLPDPEMINTVLENFTLLQHITNRTTGELMYVIAFVFEATDSGGPYHHIYQLVKNLGHGGVLPENISQQTALHLN